MTKKIQKSWRQRQGRRGRSGDGNPAITAQYIITQDLNDLTEYVLYAQYTEPTLRVHKSK